MTPNRDNVIRWAREAGFDTDLPGFQDGSAIALKLASAAFAAGAAAEREAKEELLDALQDLLMDTQHSEHECEDKNCPVANAKNVALKHAAIRARGQA